MKLKLTSEMTIESMAQVLQDAEDFPYKVRTKKNPLMGFQYVEVEKSGAVGVWIRVFEKKGRVQLMNAMPSTLVRVLFGGLLLIAFTYGAQSKIRKQAGAILMEAFGTSQL
jgi:hypothetical protein